MEIVLSDLVSHDMPLSHNPKYERKIQSLRVLVLDVYRNAAIHFYRGPDLSTSLSGLA